MTYAVQVESLNGMGLFSVRLQVISVVKGVNKVYLDLCYWMLNILMHNVLSRVAWLQIDVKNIMKI